MTVKYFKSKKLAEELKADGALAITGTVRESDERHLNQFIRWIKKYSPLKEDTVYVTRGEYINEYYGFTGPNAYPKDTILAFVKKSNIEKTGSIEGRRFNIGADWFDSLLDMKSRRQRAYEACNA